MVNITISNTGGSCVFWTAGFFCPWSGVRPEQTPTAIACLLNSRDQLMWSDPSQNPVQKLIGRAEQYSGTVNTWP